MTPSHPHKIYSIYPNTIRVRAKNLIFFYQNGKPELLRNTTVNLKCMYVICLDVCLDGFTDLKTFTIYLDDVG